MVALMSSILTGSLPQRPGPSSTLSSVMNVYPSLSQTVPTNPFRQPQLPPIPSPFTPSSASPFISPFTSLFPTPGTPFLSAAGDDGSAPTTQGASNNLGLNEILGGITNLLHQVSTLVGSLGNSNSNRGSRSAPPNGLRGYYGGQSGLQSVDPTTGNNGNGNNVGLPTDGVNNSLAAFPGLGVPGLGAPGLGIPGLGRGPGLDGGLGGRGGVAGLLGGVNGLLGGLGNLTGGAGDLTGGLGGLLSYLLGLGPVGNVAQRLPLGNGLQEVSAGIAGDADAGLPDLGSGFGGDANGALNGAQGGVRSAAGRAAGTAAGTATAGASDAAALAAMLDSFANKIAKMRSDVGVKDRAEVQTPQIRSLRAVPLDASSVIDQAETVGETAVSEAVAPGEEIVKALMSAGISEQEMEALETYATLAYALQNLDVETLSPEQRKAIADQANAAADSLQSQK